MLHCHHCSAVQPALEHCPACGSPDLARIGAGTQRLERELAEHFPELERIRLDADAAAKPGALAEALARFASTDRAVLLGTQMVAKGHDFSGVALAAVVDADTGMALPDFRAEERTFQLITQLAGRSGREAPGRVIVQTFQPDSVAVEYAARHDVERFMAHELERRRELGYPPFRHLVRVLVAGDEPAPVERLLVELRKGLEGVGADLLGPGAAPAPARPAPLPARGEDAHAARRRRPRRADARRGVGRDAARRADRRRRRRSAVALAATRGRHRSTRNSSVLTIAGTLARCLDA